MDDLIGRKEVVVGVESSGRRVQLPQFVLLGLDQFVVVYSEIQVLPQHCLLAPAQQLVELPVLRQVIMHLLVYGGLDDLVLRFYLLVEERIVKTLDGVSPFDCLLHFLPLLCEQLGLGGVSAVEHLEEAKDGDDGVDNIERHVFLWQFFPHVIQRQAELPLGQQLDDLIVVLAAVVLVAVVDKQFLFAFGLVVDGIVGAVDFLSNLEDHLLLEFVPLLVEPGLHVPDRLHFAIGLAILSIVIVCQLLARLLPLHVDRRIVRVLHRPLELGIVVHEQVVPQCA